MLRRSPTAASERVVARALLLIVLVLLAAGAAYGVGAYRAARVTTSWSPSWKAEEVVSGNCSRVLRLLPTLRKPFPDFITYGGKHFVRRAQPVDTLPSGAVYTGRWLQNWKLYRAGERLYIGTGLKGRGQVQPRFAAYEPGTCSSLRSARHE